MTCSSRLHDVAAYFLSPPSFTSPFELSDCASSGCRAEECRALSGL